MPEKIGNVLNWASTIEANTLEQAQATARLPFLAGHLALMPDAHFGFGSTVGSVIPTKGAIVPAAIGVDIGCGMGAIHLDVDSHALGDDLTELHHAIRRAIPAGLGKQHLQPHPAYDSHGLGMPPATDVSPRQRDKIVRQLGTLGGGNHFVEICLDEHDDVWLMLHSGSRGIGKELAEKHVDTAKGLMKQWFIELEHPDLAYFPEHTPEFDAYIADMLWAQNYAMANRREMLTSLLDVALRHFWTRSVPSRSGGTYVLQTVNCHHNFTEREHHHGRNMWVTRKGAIRARDGELGIIPGSMGTRSYIVAGKGSPASYCSCSHGAGRRLGRKQAERTLTVESLREAMGDRTWDADKAAQLVDEHPMAYKDIDLVMADQADLVDVVATLRQVLNYKGTE